MESRYVRDFEQTDQLFDNESSGRDDESIPTSQSSNGLTVVHQAVAAAASPNMAKVKLSTEDAD